MNYENERWVEMYGFPNYEISNYGRIKSYRNKKILKQVTDGASYMMVRLFYNGQKFTKRVSRLVWQSFNNCGCPETIDHIDKNSLNDNLNNLRCIPLKEQYKNKTPRNEQRRWNIQPQMKRMIQQDFESGHSYRSLAFKYKLPYNYIRTTLVRGSWKKYLNEGI